MKTTLHKSLIILLIAGTFTLAQGQVLQYNFNDAAGTTAANTGTAGTTDNLKMYANGGTATDYLSPYSSGGVPFLDGSGTLNLTSATGMGGGGAIVNTGPYGLSSTAGSVFNGISSFTIAGWYNTSISTWNSARLLQTGNLILFGNSASNIVLQLPTSSSTITVTSNSGGSGSAFSSTNTGNWTFVAATVNNLTGQVVFYQGTQAGASSLLSYTNSFAAGTAVLSGFSALDIGGSVSGGNNSRPFDGSLDDFNVYTAADGSGALTSSQISALLSAQAVPEPAPMGALMMGLLALGLVQLFRKGRRA